MGIKTQVGPQQVADGSNSELRQGRSGEMIVQDANGRYYELTKRGNLWCLSTAAAGVTIAAANVLGNAAAPQPIIGIYNPTSSGKDAVILRVRHYWASGTAGAGGLVWAVIPSGPMGNLTAAGSSGGVSPYSMATGGHVVKTFTNAALTGVANATGTLLRSVGGPTTGAAAANAGLTFEEETAGGIVVQPGTFAGLFAAAAGTSPIVLADFEWAELPSIQP